MSVSAGSLGALEGLGLSSPTRPPQPPAQDLRARILLALALRRALSLSHTHSHKHTYTHTASQLPACPHNQLATCLECLTGRPCGQVSSPFSGGSWAQGNRGCVQWGKGRQWGRPPGPRGSASQPHPWAAVPPKTVTSVPLVNLREAGRCPRPRAEEMASQRRSWGGACSGPGLPTRPLCPPGRVKV